MWTSLRLAAAVGMTAFALPALAENAPNTLSNAPNTLSVEHVLALDEVRSFLGQQALKEANPRAPAQTREFGRLVGVWEVDLEMRGQDGRWHPGGQAVWIWKHALGGFAIQDLFIHPKDHLPVYLKSLDRTYLLTSVRVYEPASSQWQVAWAANGAAQAGGPDFGTFTASTAGDDVVMRGSSSFGEQRVTFSEITSGSFVWTSEYSRDGKEWMAVLRMRARRASPSP